MVISGAESEADQALTGPGKGRDERQCGTTCRLLKTRTEGLPPLMRLMPALKQEMDPGRAGLPARLWALREASRHGDHGWTGRPERLRG